MPDTLDLSSAVFAKTDIGQQEIQSRSLGLSSLARRILVLADGKKRGSELAAFLPSADEIHTVLEQLLSLGCLRAEANSQPAHAPAATTASANAPPGTAPSADLSGLPPADKRSAKDNEMARNFMINSINSIIGQQMRITLVNDIFHAETTEALRAVYHAWAASMSDHGVGKKRLPELRDKLFKVL